MGKLAPSKMGKLYGYSPVAFFGVHVVFVNLGGNISPIYTCKLLDKTYICQCMKWNFGSPGAHSLAINCRQTMLCFGNIESGKTRPGLLYTYFIFLVMYNVIFVSFTFGILVKARKIIGSYCSMASILLNLLWGY